MTRTGGDKMRRLCAEDIPAATLLSAQAGWNQTAEDWRTLLELSPEGCLAIEVDGHLAATTTLLCYGRRLAWIGMVLTKAEYQRRGFARRLLARALENADTMGIATIKLDATDQGQPLYGSLGFRSEQEVERWSRAGGNELLPANRASVEESWRDLDSPVFGTDRSQLLERLARLNPPSSISRSYLFTRSGRVTAYLGPCVSKDPRTARHLIEECVQNARCAWSWDLFPRNQDAVALARDLGFSPHRRLMRMARGKELCEKPKAIYAIAGFELG
ncbi:MAG TPA: GNAT family N-acetyltransferase [Candidatus Sulfotelmatobacter sp.]|nr:GNAT family N-acetyltransferase [Candidatus Sulfotelmatobacter sp.]